MALARVVTFDGVDKDRIAEMKREMEGSERPEGVSRQRDDHPARSGRGQVGRDRLLRERGRLQGGDAALDAMPTGDTPGTRTSVTKYDVAIRMQA